MPAPKWGPTLAKNRQLILSSFGVDLDKLPLIPVGMKKHRYRGKDPVLIKKYQQIADLRKGRIRLHQLMRDLLIECGMGPGNRKRRQAMSGELREHWRHQHQILDCYLCANREYALGVAACKRLGYPTKRDDDLTADEDDGW